MQLHRQTNLPDLYGSKLDHMQMRSVHTLADLTGPVSFHPGLRIYILKNAHTINQKYTSKTDNLKQFLIGNQSIPMVK